MHINTIASLPWYDSEVKRGALDQFWYAAAQFLGDAGIDRVPRELTRDQSLASLWRSPNLILSQCCGPDLLTEKGSDLYAVARPVFAELDCTPGYYYSYIVSRTEQPDRTARIVVNSLTSRSGYTALTEWMELNGTGVSEVKISGSHAASLAMLEQGMADIAAIDAHTVHQLGIKLSMPVIGKSTEALTPPYVYNRSSAVSSDVLLQALIYAVQQRGTDIGITDVIESDRSCYEKVFGVTIESGTS